MKCMQVLFDRGEKSGFTFCVISIPWGSFVGVIAGVMMVMIIMTMLCVMRYLFVLLLMMMVGMRNGHVKHHHGDDH